MVSGMDAMLSCIFTSCDVRMRIAITCTLCPGATSGVLIKKSRFLGVVLSGGKTVKEELNVLAVSDSFEYQIYGFTTIRHYFTVTVRGSILDITV